MKNFDLKNDSIAIGKSTSYFSVMKKSNPVLFRFCCFYSKRTLVEGYNKLIMYFENLKVQIQNIYYNFDYPYDFAKWLANNNIYKNAYSSYSINSVFICTDIIKISYIHKLKLIKKTWYSK